MPDGKVHGIATLACCVVASATVAYLTYSAEYTLATSAGWITTLSINPDLDLNQRVTFRQPHQLLWRLYWYPYSRLFGHRSFFSHAPVVSTLLRIMYISIVVVPLLHWLGVRKYDWAIWLMGGMICSDILHYVMDIVSTWIKRHLH